MASNANQFGFRREVRLGVVLYGGVSLAVYINGVAQEMFRAVRGHGLYGFLKLLTDSDCVVDVISGTSAGGLNGIYLGYALTAPGTRNFLRFSNLWREQGDIGKLLHTPSGKPEKRHSLLDGEGYYQSRLAEAFSDLDNNPPLVSPLASEVRELDCFVTGTDVGGDVYTRFDDRGQPITVKEHRQVFQLKHREGRYSDFSQNSVCHQAMAKLARITSCFPVAFPPVTVNPRAAAGEPDALLVKWGRLDRKGKSAQRVYLDGGVLDNKPFSHTLNTIFRRTTQRTVKRVLYYVEPVPEVFEEEQTTESPDILGAAIGATLDLPRYESISADLESVLERNRRLEQIRRILESTRYLRTAPDSDLLPAVSQMQMRVYEHARAMQLVTRMLEGVLRRDGRNVLIEAGLMDRARRLTENFFNTWTDGGGSGLLLSQLKPMDVYYRLRSLFHVTYDLMGQPLLEWKTGAYTPTAAGAVLSKVNRLIALHEIMLHHLENLVDRLEVNWEDPTRSEGLIWTVVQNAFQELLPQSEELKVLLAPRDEFLATGQLSSFSDSVGARVDRIVAKSKSRDGLRDLQREPNLAFSSLCDWIDAEIVRPILNSHPVAKASWDEFPLVDVVRFPLQLTAGFDELDHIHVVRISPKDAQTAFSRRDPSSKLAGSQFSNFGGFFKKSWRSNDLMWGRLDGVCKLAEELMDRKWFESELLPRPGFADLLRSRIQQYSASFVQEFIDEPESRKETEDLLAWALDLVSPQSEVRDAALSRWDEMRETLVRAEQRSIIREGWPVVLQDSITEMLDWNRIATDSGSNDPAPIFDVQRMRFDRQVSAQAAAAFAHFGLRHVMQTQSLKQAFDSQYRVGEERILTTLPPSILAETASKAMLVLRDCLLDALGDERAAKVLSSTLFRFGVDFPTRSVYNFARFGRYAPESAQVFVFTLFGAGFTALAATLISGLQEWTWFRWMTYASVFGVATIVAGVVFRLVVLRKHAPR
jgi:patatin-related protein